jgi:hypothetical protein
MILLRESGEVRCDEQVPPDEFDHVSTIARWRSSTQPMSAASTHGSLTWACGGETTPRARCTARRGSARRASFTWCAWGPSLRAAGVLRCWARLRTVSAWRRRWTVGVSVVVSPVRWVGCASVLRSGSARTRMTLEPVLGNRLPRCGGIDELPMLRTDSRIAVERSQPDRYLRVAERLSAEQRGAAVRAEQLGHADGRLEGAQLLLSLQDLEALLWHTAVG